MNEETARQILEYASNTEVLAVDTEGFSEFDNKKLDEGVTTGVSMAGNGFEAYFPFNHVHGDNLSGEILNAVKNTIENQKAVVFHNAKHDIIALEKLGIKTGYFYDTMLMAHFIDENIPSKKLDYLSRMYGGEPKILILAMSGIINILGWAYVPIEMMEPYSANDSRITWDLFYKLYPEFKAQGFDNELWDIEQEYSRVLGRMELRGVRIDKELCARENTRGQKIMGDIAEELRFNPNSQKELKAFLIDELGLPVVKKTKSDNPSFDKKAMEIYDELLTYNNDPRAKLVARYRGWLKTCSSNYKPYIERLSSDGRLRCNFKIHGTKTGRLSCENPNLQQIPRSSEYEWNGKLKSAFIPREGYKLWEADYSQLEFRLSAAYAKEKSLIEVFNNPDRDIFNEIGKELGMPRQDVKTLTYTIAYGGGVNRIKTVFGVSAQAAAAIRDRYYKAYPNLRKISDYAARKCIDDGYIRMWTGRRRHFENPALEAHKAFNSAIQGGAAEIAKRSTIRVDKEGINNEEDCQMLLPVHDSQLFEIKIGKEKEYLPEIKRIMEDVKPDFGVKFKVDIHEWGK